MTLVVDASMVVAALVDSGPTGAWAESLLASEALAAPHLMPVEAANILRRASLTGDISHDTASLAHCDLIDLRVELFAYEPFAERIWALARTSRRTTPGTSASPSGSTRRSPRSMIGSFAPLGHAAPSRHRARREMPGHVEDGRAGNTAPSRRRRSGPPRGSGSCAGRRHAPEERRQAGHVEDGRAGNTAPSRPRRSGPPRGSRSRAGTRHESEERRQPGHVGPSPQG
ncbi:MAG: type II toxin-antitoxin system VapC family toxin [Acidimicrobiia bacterium]|nr:type II toxin-antitoxin system VapC family toxin [Acidimicrobiia bacterium]